MKSKIIIISAMLAISAMSNGASIDYLSNNSASYFQNPSQTGQISVEGIFYNPAGTIFLENGQYFNANLQNSLIEESMKLNGKKMASKEYAGAPSFNYLYKNGNVAYFGNASVIAGGATLKYDEGVAGIELAAEGFSNVKAIKLIEGALSKQMSKEVKLDPTIKNNKFSGQNRYFQLMSGAAYKLNDNISLSGGLKYVYAQRKLKGIAEFGYNSIVGKQADIVGNTLSINSTRKASGIGAVLGLNYKYDDTLNFALKYETPVKLEFKSKASETDMKIAKLSTFYPTYGDGVKSRRDLPGVLSLGVSKNIDKITLSSGYIHYFNKSAKMDGVKYKDGFEWNAGLDYKINEKFTGHLGYNYAKTGAPKETFNDTEYAINSQIYTTGLTYRPNKNHEWKFGYGFVNYKGSNGIDETKEIIPKTNTLPAQYLTLDKSKVKYDKRINVFTLGYTYKF